MGQKSDHKTTFNSGKSNQLVFNRSLVTGSGQAQEKGEKRPMLSVDQEPCLKSSSNSGNLTQTFFYDTNANMVIRAQPFNFSEVHVRAWDRQAHSKGKPRMALSEPSPDVNYKEKLAGNKRHFRSKQRSNFTNGRICRWEDFEDTSRPSNLSVNHDSAFNAIEDNLGKEKFKETKDLKVCSRARARSSNVVRLEGKGVLMEEDIVVMDSGLTGINYDYLDWTHHPSLHHQIQRRNFFQTVLQRKPRMRS